MEQDIKPGDLVFLTQAYEEYMLNKNPRLRVPLINRLAKVEDIIDWTSEKGKSIKDARVKSGKWNDLPIEENKYILSIYYQDLVGRNGQRGVIERGVPMFRYHPKSTGPNRIAFFEKAPDWIYKELTSKCLVFNVEDKEANE